MIIIFLFPVGQGSVLVRQQLREEQTSPFFEVGSKPVFIISEEPIPAYPVNLEIIRKNSRYIELDYCTILKSGSDS